MSNNPTDSSEETTWRIGLFMVLVIFLIVVFELVLAFWWTSHSNSRDALLFGFHFGLLGSLTVWTNSKRIQRRFLAFVGAIVGAGVIGIAHQYCEGGWISLSQSAGFNLLFVSFALLVLVCLAAFRFGAYYLSKDSASKGEEVTPQFGVSQLLGLMVVTAVLASVVRLAMPEIGQLLDPVTVIVVVSWATIAVAAGLLLLDRPPSFWRLGIFAAFGVVAGFVVSSLTGWDTVIYAAVVQVAVLAACVVLPQLDRYTIRITLEPHETAGRGPSTEPSPSEGPGEGGMEQTGAE